MSSIGGFWLQIQKGLFPFVEVALEERLTPRLRQLIRTLELLRIEDKVEPAHHQWMGRKRCDRGAVARAFIAKAVFNLPTTQSLIEMLQRDRSVRRICGWEYANRVPSAATFSRAFDEFTRAGLGDVVLEDRVKAFIGDGLVMHVSRDSTEIHVREKALKKVKEPKTKRDRRRRGQRRGEMPGDVLEPPEQTRLERQMGQTAEEALSELPRGCDIGRKVDPRGLMHYWRGMKTHLDWADGQIPVNALTTAASMHDSQAAIPMMKQTGERVTSCYDVMDSAYDANPILQVSRELGHVPIIEIHKRRTRAIPFDPATAQRYKVRTTAERGNSRLKDEFGARHVRVRGPKVHMHVMFGVLALFADQMFKLVT